MGRYTAAISGKFDSVNFFTKLNDESLNQLVAAINSQYELVVVTVPSNGRLFFPSNALVFYFDISTAECSFGVPFDGRNILFSIKKGSDLNLLQQQVKDHFFINLSMGNNASKFCIVHPELLDQKDTLKEVLPRVRTENSNFAQKVSGMRTILDDIRNSLKE